MTIMRAFKALLAIAVVVALAGGAAYAQVGYPNRPIRILVPFGAGGIVDQIARYYGEHLRKALGQNVVVVNKAGASGIIAVEELVHAKPDGYTIMIGNISTMCLAPILYAKRSRVNYSRDVQIIARLAEAPVFFLATTTNFAPKTFQDFIDYAKAHPGDVRYASGGLGAYQHVNTEILAKRAGGLRLVHIPFKDGGIPILKDLASGDTQVSWFNVTNAVGMIKAGKIRPLALAATQRLPAWPDVPTLDELGFTGFHPSQWSAMFTSAGVPRAIVDKLHNALTDASKSREMQAIFERGGMVAMTDTSADEASAWLKIQTETWQRDIAEAGIKLDE